MYFCMTVLIPFTIFHSLLMSLRSHMGIIPNFKTLSTSKKRVGEKGTIPFCVLMIIKQFNVDKVKPINICWTKHQFLGYQWEKASKKLPEEGKNLHIKMLLQFTGETICITCLCYKYVNMPSWLPNMHQIRNPILSNIQLCF